MAPQQGVLERHQDEVNDLAGHGCGCTAGQLSLRRVALEHGSESVLPEIDQAVVLTERGLIAAQALHDDEAQEVAVVVHDVDGAAGHPQQALLERHVGGRPLQLLKTSQETALLDQGLQEIALGLEMVVDGSISDAGGARDIAHGGAGEPPLGEEVQ